MAKFTGSAVVGDVRNKAGGVVFQNNRAGGMIRTKVSSVQPQTAAQRSTRSLTQTLNKQWHFGLSAGIRLAWERFAAEHPFPVKLGDPAPTTGYLLFMRLARNHWLTNANLIGSPPSSLTVGQPQTAALTASAAGGGVFSLSWNPAPGTHDDVIVAAAPPTSPGRQARESEYRYLHGYGAGNPGPVNPANLYHLRFGDIRAGMNVHLQVWFISTTTYMDSQRVRVSTVVTP